jgi:hypothetical protein
VVAREIPLLAANGKTKSAAARRSKALYKLRAKPETAGQNLRKSMA